MSRASNKVTPIVSNKAASWHWWAFADFCAKKELVKEPSPHMQMIGELTKDVSAQDRIWFACLYTAFYNIPSALVMWSDWPWEKAYNNSHQIKYWLQQHWSGITTRTERRAVRTVTNMYQCMESLVSWCDRSVPEYLRLADTHENYDTIWQDANSSLRFMGRYIIIRLLESLHRFSGLQPKLYDIRSIGGWSPKRCLGLLFPEHLELLLSPDTKENVKKVDAIAFEAIDKIRSEYSLSMSPYVFAAMLCEYRVAYENLHQYPGWTIDQEPTYWYKIKDYWTKNRGSQFVSDIEMKFFGTRRTLFPEECLGELHNWEGTRIEPRAVLKNYGYNWIDTEYDYTATTDFSNPVRRERAASST